MKIYILGPAHPYRGGLASIMETMARTFQQRGDEVEILTFKVQYPDFLFPGKSQTLTTPPPEDLQITRAVNTVNPLNWIAIGRKIRREKPDFVLLKYWTPFMAPCFGTIARIARRNHHTKFICQIDNVEPHESHVVDRPFNRYFLRAIDGFIYMSEQVHSELKTYTSAPALFSPHPMFENLGARVDRDEACRAIGIEPKNQYALFFGLIRDYKGVDLLLEAWSKLKRESRLPQSRKLIIAGEFYTDKKPYTELIERNGLKNDVILRDMFIADEDVKNYFSTADVVVLPYKTATQSGVTQIAYNFSLPMIVTDVGGLPEIVPNGKVGIICQPAVASIAEAIDAVYKGDTLSRFVENMHEERKRFSWSTMCDRITELYEKVK